MLCMYRRGQFPLLVWSKVNGGWATGGRRRWTTGGRQGAICLFPFAALQPRLIRRDDSERCKYDDSPPAVSSPYSASAASTPPCCTTAARHVVRQREVREEHEHPVRHVDIRAPRPTEAPRPGRPGTLNPNPKP
jgi:hypothetical protein